MIERIASKDEMRATVIQAKRDGMTVGFVPTMGALHAGHLSLVEAARARTGLVVVSIFVNPTQFSEGEDFEHYPRDIEADLRRLGADGVDIAFTPSVETMYASDAEVTVDPGGLAMLWEGAVRPGHFRGVATVVTKLLNIVRPDLAFFGEKDYQQLKIVQHLVRDLDIGVGVVGGPIVRDADGLALSSRNAYLSAEERAAALALPEALEAVARALAWGEVSGDALAATMREAVRDRVGDAIVLDYAAVVDAETLEPVDRIEEAGVARAIIAGRVGTTRLIDNCALAAPMVTAGGMA